MNVIFHEDSDELFFQRLAGLNVMLRFTDSTHFDAIIVGPDYDDGVYDNDVLVTPLDADGFPLKYQIPVGVDLLETMEVLP